MTDWDTEFDNSGHVPGSSDLPARWAAEAEAYRAGEARVEADIPYGDAPREKLDIVWPDGTPKGLAVFVHGGYWMRLSKSDWTHLAEGARASGWAVALPGYTLTPEVRISDITRQIGKALEVASARVDGPIRLSGHSAGGHLVSRMMCADGVLPEAVLARVAHVLAISGLFDLRPLLRTGMNETLGLDLPEARAESAALLEPVTGSSLTAWVGGGERREFQRQSDLLVRMWAGFDVETRLVLDGAHDHFSVIEGLKAKGSAICRAFVGA